MNLVVLDTSVLLSGHEPPPGRRVATSPEALAEITPGGRDARRLSYWIAAGLEERSAGQAACARVDEVANQAGTSRRLSAADRSLLALALELEAELWTNDHTMLDVARRLGAKARSVSTPGIEGTKDFRPRCAGCGRWFDASVGLVCPVCGSAVRDRPVRPR